MVPYFKKEDYIVGFLVLTVLCGLIYQGFSSLVSVQDLAHSFGL